MINVGCDFHPCWQHVAALDPETGEIRERKLPNGTARRSGSIVPCRYRARLRFARIPPARQIPYRREGGYGHQGIPVSHGIRTKETS